MFDLMEDFGAKLSLLGQMVRITGADTHLGSPVIDDSHWTACITTCLACPHGSACSKWLAEATVEQSAAHQPAPGFCGNAERLAAFPASPLPLSLQLRPNP